VRTLHLYRLAHPGPYDDFTQVGSTYLSLESACIGSVTQNNVRKKFGLPPLTHVVIYTQTGICELQNMPWSIQ
jgi:hypothetical protein